MGKPTVADLSAELDALRTRVTALEESTDPEAFDDRLDGELSEDDLAAIALAEGERHAAIAEVLELIEVEVHGDLAPLVQRLREEHGCLDYSTDGWARVEIHYIEAMARDDIRLALRNWCNAARRELAAAA